MPSFIRSFLRTSKNGVQFLKQSFSDRQFLLALFAALISWVGLAACFPPYTLVDFSFPPAFKGVFSFVVLVPFFIVVSKRSYKEITIIAFVAGFIHHALTFYWLGYVMDSGQDVSTVVAIGMFFLMSYMAVYVVFLGLSFKFLYKRSLLWLYPLVWVGIELVKSKGEISIPWSHIGYTLGGYQTLLQSLAYIGIFGYSVLIIGANICWFYFWKTRKRMFVVYGLLPILFLGITGTLILNNQIPGTEFGDIVVTQPSIVQKDKWIKRNFTAVVDKTIRTAELINSDSADLIVYPETAIPEYMKNVSRVSDRLQKMAYEKHSNILMGSLDYERLPPGGPRKYKVFNSGFLFSRDSTVPIRKYDKNRLVPFSERLPWEDIIPVIQHVNMGEGDFTAGTESPAWDDIRFSAQICYEVVYPYFVRNAIRNGARIIVVITNDAWFRRSTQPYQHANLLRFRAIENGISIIQSANTGISVMYDSYGTVLDKAELYERKAMRKKVPLKNRTTLYSKVGDVVENTVFGFFLILCCWMGYSFFVRLKAGPRRPV